MEFYKKVVSFILVAVGIASVSSILIFLSLSNPSRLLMNHVLIVMSGYTSLAALGVSLWTYWKYQVNVENPLEEMKGRTDTLVEDLNEGFLEELIDSLIQAEKRFASMPQRKQKRVVKMIEKYQDLFFRRMEEVPEEPPNKKVNTAVPREE